MRDAHEDNEDSLLLTLSMAVCELDVVIAGLNVSALLVEGAGDTAGVDMLRALLILRLGAGDFEIALGEPLGEGLLPLGDGLFDLCFEAPFLGILPNVHSAES